MPTQAHFKYRLMIQILTSHVHAKWHNVEFRTRYRAQQNVVWDCNSLSDPGVTASVKVEM